MPRKVVFIGIFGCSGSGKTSVASQLALKLHSPFFAISLDRYYDDSKVELYKTAEHFHTLCIAECYNDLMHLKAKLQNAETTSSVHTLLENLLKDTSLSTELRSAVHVVEKTEEKQHEKLISSREEERDLLHGTKVTKESRWVTYEKSENDVNENNAADYEDYESEDESLKAHEEEDYNTRYHYTTFSEDTINMKENNKDDNLDVSRENRAHEKYELNTLYVVCEGFVLFCVPSISQYYALFDVYVEVLCEADTMCYRRFCRTPRRSHSISSTKRKKNVIESSLKFNAETLEKSQKETHTLQNKVYHERSASNKRMHQRLMLLSSSRTEEWRQELQKHISYLYTSSLSKEELQVWETDNTEKEEVNEEAVNLDAYHEMLEPQNYFPPNVMLTTEKSISEVSYNISECTLKNNILLPASAFAQFWQDVNHSHAIPLWARLQEKEQEYFAQHLAHKLHSQIASHTSVHTKEELPQEQITNVCINEQVWNEYCQFRYWFFFEVYYYYLLFLPCQRHFVHGCIRHKEHQYVQQQSHEQQHLCKPTKCLSLTCNNGRDVNAQKLQARVRQLTELIQSQYNY